MSMSKVCAQFLVPVSAAAMLTGVCLGAWAAPRDFNPTMPISSSALSPMLNAENPFGPYTGPVARRINHARVWSAPLGSVPIDDGVNRNVTGADLVARGARQLGELEIKQLIATRTVIVRDRASGFEITYGTDGWCLIRPEKDSWRALEEVGDVPHLSGLGVPSRYHVLSDGRLRASLEGEDFTMTVYKDGDAYVAIKNDASPPAEK